MYYTRKFFFIAIMLFFAAPVFSQADTAFVPPYLQSKSLPAMRLVLPDSTTFFTKADVDKKKQVMVMLFNPQCSHCQMETEDILHDIDKFKDIQIIMVTSMGYDSMMVFRERYHLADHKNIVVAYDPNFTMISFYLVNQIPTLALYNREKQFISIFPGGLKVDRIMEEFEKKTGSQ